MKQLVPGRVHVLGGTGLHVVCISAEAPRQTHAQDLFVPNGNVMFTRQRATVLPFDGRPCTPTFAVWDLHPSDWRLA